MLTNIVGFPTHGECSLNSPPIHSHRPTPLPLLFGFPWQSPWASISPTILAC